MTNQLEAKKVASQSGVKIIPGPLTEIQTLSQFRNAGTISLRFVKLHYFYWSYEKQNTLDTHWLLNL